MSNTLKGYFLILHEKTSDDPNMTDAFFHRLHGFLGANDLHGQVTVMRLTGRGRIIMLRCSPAVIQRISENNFTEIKSVEEEIPHDHHA